MKILILVLLIIFLGCENSQNSTQKEENSTALKITIKKPPTQNFATQKWINYDISGEKRINFGLGENNETTKILGAYAMRKAGLQNINKSLLRGKLSKNFLQKCSACHDDLANGIIGPSLLTKNENEIFTMIKAYKNEQKANILMVELVQKMSDSEILALAKEISDFNAQFRGQK